MYAAAMRQRLASWDNTAVLLTTRAALGRGKNGYEKPYTEAWDSSCRTGYATCRSGVT
jgi:hypothetical protein